MASDCLLDIPSVWASYCGLDWSWGRWHLWWLIDWLVDFSPEPSAIHCTFRVNQILCAAVCILSGWTSWPAISITDSWSEAAGVEVLCSLESMSYSFWDQDQNLMLDFLMSSVTWSLGFAWMMSHRICFCLQKLDVCLLSDIATWKLWNHSSLRTQAHGILLDHLGIDTPYFFYDMVNNCLRIWHRTIEDSEEKLGLFRIDKKQSHIIDSEIDLECECWSFGLAHAEESEGVASSDWSAGSHWWH